MDDAILWFQHETAIWADPEMFTSMLQQLNLPKIVTFHTLHFQSNETESGLRKYQYDLLKNLLPHVDAITVFTYGVYRSVVTAFPEYYAKIFVTKHGVHSYPEINKLSHKEARGKLYDFLFYESALDQNDKQALYRQRIFSDPNALLLGQTGFLCPLKHSESLYSVRDNLQQLIPDKRIVAVRIGTAREDSQRIYAQQLRSNIKDSNTFLLETWLPSEMLPLAQRAFDINFYWPDECTQSGVIAHALGAGAIVAGRDLEGVGETLKEAGQIADTDINNLTIKIKHLLLDPELQLRTEQKALKYADEFSWESQARRHYELAEPILRTIPLWEKSRLPSGINALAASAARRAEMNIPVRNQALPRYSAPIPQRPAKPSSADYPENYLTTNNSTSQPSIKPRRGLRAQIYRLTGRRLHDLH